MPASLRKKLPITLLFLTLLLQATARFTPILLPVTGKVTDNKGAPIAGVTVSEKGTVTSTSTDNSGNFTINVKDSSATLIFSYVGYESTEMTVRGQANLTVALNQATTNLGEVVVVGYGTQKRTSLTSAVSDIKGAELTRRPVSNAQQALQGLAPGVTVLDNGGAPGRSSATVRVRGITTIGVNDPLVIIDGIEQRLTDVNPEDIETMSILKDASSTAIYGSRAANGVLLITTKRAKAGKVAVDYNGYYAIQNAINKPEMMDLESYMRLQVAAYTNVGATVPARFSEQSIQTYITTTDREKYPMHNVWFDELLKPAPQHSHTLAVSGGGENFRGRMSVRYMDQDGIAPGFEAGIREFRVNTDFNVTKTIKVSADANYRYNNSTVPIADVFNIMLHGSLWAVPKYGDGTYGLSQQGNNPLMFAEKSGSSTITTDNLIGNLKGEWGIVKGLKLSSQFGARIINARQKSFTNAYTNTDKNTNITRTVAINSLTEGRQYIREFTWNNLLTYENTFGKHDVKGLLGYSEIDNISDTLSAYRERFYNNDIQSISQGANDGTRNNGGNQAAFGLRSFFGRVNYAYDDKYLFEANARYDGSSRFTGENQYSFFPSFSAGWRLSQEKFWDGIADIVNEFKVRGSWGKTGNQTVGLYSYFESLSQTSYTFGGLPVSGYRPVNLANKDITWETTIQTDFGFDAQFMNGRLTASFDYYNKQTEGILLNLPIPAVIGLTAPPQNAGVVENKGIELQAGYRSERQAKIRYDISANFSINNNNVVSLAGTGPYISGSDIDPRFIIAEGLPINTQWGYKTAGLFQTAEEIQKYPTLAAGTKPGDVKYVDLNSDGIINASDMTNIGYSFPKYTYGTNITVGYKNFDLNLFFQGAAEVNTRISGALAEQGNYEGFTHTIITNNYWTPENRNARFPRPTKLSLTNTATADRLVVDGSYIRLKNVQLVYTLPVALAKRWSMNRASVYISGTNLLTISELNEWNLDPETPSGRANYYPQTSLITFGVNVQF
jgi:TonB-linked SusC/RagA family outer membrane protein